MIARTLRGLGALAVVTAGLIGWPAALITAGSAAGEWLPDLTDPIGLLARPDTGGLFLALILALGAVAWLFWTVALIVEIAGQVRGVPTPRLGGLFPQHSAAALVTAIAIAFSLTPTAPALASPATAASPAGSATSASQAAAQAVPDAPSSSGADSVREYEVVAGDTLWDIADEQLDDPYRWSAIAEASEQITQPDGQHLADPDLIRPGWTLHIPTPDETAATPAEPPAAPADPQPYQGADGAANVAPPDTPLRPTATRTTSPGAAAASAPAPVESPLPTAPLRSGPAEGDQTQSWHGVTGLPDWVRPPFKPTRLTDAPDVHAALVTVLPDRDTV